MNRWQGLPGTATFRSVNGYEGWSTESQLLAAVVDALNGANWQRENEGKKNPSARPKPLERPWRKPNSVGSGAVPYDEIDEWMRSTWE